MKSSLKTAFHRGFTLIELMIVIVIIGILVTTLVPRITGTQGRARDTGRLADLNQISQAAEVYLDDFGSYPPNAQDGTPDCLKDGSLPDFAAFTKYFKGGVPTPPNETETVTFDGVSCTGSYMYLALDNQGSNNNSYAIIANVETPTKGNLIIDNGVTTPPPATLAFDASTTFNDVQSVLDDTAKVGPTALSTADEEDDDGDSTVYLLLQ